MQKYIFLGLCVISSVSVFSNIVTVTNGNNDGAGSLRQAISDVTSDGTVEYGSALTTTLTSTLPISKNLGGITNAGQYDATIKGSDIVLNNAELPFVGITIASDITCQNESHLTLNAQGVQTTVFTVPVLSVSGAVTIDPTSILEIRGTGSDVVNLGAVNLQCQGNDHATMIIQSPATGSLIVNVNDSLIAADGTQTTLGANTTFGIVTGSDAGLGDVSGAGAIIKSENSFFTISGSATYTGPTLLNDGTMFFTGSNFTCPSDFSGTGGAISFGSSSVSPTGQEFSGSFTGNYLIAVGGQATLSGTLNTTGAININNGDLSITGDVPGLSGDINLETGSLQIGSTTQDLPTQIYNGFMGTPALFTSAVTITKQGNSFAHVNGEFALNSSSQLNVNSGVLFLSNIQNSFGAPITINNTTPGTALQLTHTSNRTVGSNISGAGKLINDTSGGSTTLTGDLSVPIVNFSGNLIILGDISNTPLSMTGGSITVGNTSSITSAQEIDIQTGNFIKQGTGSVSLTGNLNSDVIDSSIATNNPAIQVQQGTLFVSPTQYDYNGSYAVTSGASLQLSQDKSSDLRQFPNAITGAGSLIIDVSDGSDVEFTSDDFTLSGGISFAPAAPVIQPSNAIFSGNYTNLPSSFTIPSSFTVVVRPSDASDTQLFSGDISGLGLVEKEGSGTSTFTGNSTGSLFELLDGTLNLQGQSIGSVNLQAGVLNLGSNATTVQQATALISGNTGVINKVGTGTTNIPTNTFGFSKNVNIKEGTLQVADSLSGPIDVSSGAILKIDTTAEKSISGPLTGDGKLIASVGNGLTLSNSTVGIKSIDLQGGTLSFSAANTGNENLDISLDGSTILTFSPSSTQTFTFSTITGAGNVQVTSGTATLDGNAAYTGTTTLNGGNLNFAGSVDNLKSNIVLASGTVGFGAGSNLTQTFSGNISGPGSVNQNSKGLTTLKGELSYAGNTTVSKGTLLLDTVLNNLNSNFQVKSGAELQFGNNGAQTISGNISGKGNVTQLGATETAVIGIGKTTLEGTISYSGTTTLEENSVLTLASVPSASFNGDIIIGFDAVFEDTINTSHTLSNSFSGPGDITLSGTGTTTLNGPLSVAGLGVEAGTTALTGVLQDLDAFIFIRDGATLNVGASSSILQNISGDLNGAGLLLKTGSNTTTFSGLLDYYGTISVSEGVLSLQGDVSILNETISVSNGATIEFGNNASSQALSANVTGAGNLKKSGSNTVTIASTLDYVGTTTVTEGTLSITGQASALTGNMAISDGANLQFGRDSSQAIGANISGLGQLSKNSSGTTTLSGTLTNEGETSVLEGILNLTGDVSNWISEISISSGATLQDSINSAHTISNAITGSGNFTKATSSALTLSGDLSYSGTTRIQGGSLALTQALTDFKNTIILENDSTFIVGSKNNTQQITGDIQGFGSVVKNNNGKTFLNGDHSFSQDLTINAGTLAFLSPITQFAGSITISSGATFDIGANGTQTLTSDVAGGGTLVKLNSGRSEISGTYSHTGTINIEEGILAIDGISTTLTGPINISKDAFFEFGSPGSHTLTNVIRGEGGFIDAASGTTTLSGGYSFTGDTQVKSGALVLDGKIKNYPGNVTLASNTSLKLGSTSDQKLTGNITGDGSVTKSGSGALTLSGDLSYTGDTVFSAGEMTFNGPITNMTSNIQISDGLVLNLSSNLALREEQIFSGQIKGLGGVRVDGFVAFGGDVSYQGDTAVSGDGRLQLSGDFSALTGTIRLEKGGEIGIENETDTTLNLNIVGNGDLFKLGSKELIIDRPLTINGDVIVADGSLVINTTIDTHDIRVGPDGTVKGSGKVGSLTSSGLVAPGESIGTLSVAGNYTQNAGGALEIEFDDTQADLLQVSGDVILNPGSRVLFTPDGTRFADGTTYTFVTAGRRVKGEFTTIDIARNTAIDVHMIGVDYFEDSINLVIHSATHIKQALNLQAEMALKSSQAQLENFKAVNDRNLYSYDWCSKGDCANNQSCEDYPCKNQGWDIYALTSYTAFDLKQTTNRRGGHIKASATTVGAEYVFDDYGSFGAGFGYTYGQVVHPAGFSTKTKSQAFTFGVNAIYAPIDFISFDFVGNIDKVWYDTKRMTTSFYSGQDATSNPQGLSANASLRVMPRICLFSTLFQPYFSSEYSWRHIQKFRENGPVDVSYESSKTSLSYWSAEAGGMISKTFKVNDLCLIPHFNAAYVFKYNTPKIDNSLITITDDNTLITTTNEFDEFTTNYVKVGGGLDILNKDTFRVFLEANGFIKDQFNASFDARFGFNVYF